MGVTYSNKSSLFPISIYSLYTFIIIYKPDLKAETKTSLYSYECIVTFTDNMCASLSTKLTLYLHTHNLDQSIRFLFPNNFDYIHREKGRHKVLAHNLGMRVCSFHLSVPPNVYVYVVHAYWNCPKLLSYHTKTMYTRMQ